VTREHVFVILTRLGIALSFQHSADRDPSSVGLNANRGLGNWKSRD